MNINMKEAVERVFNYFENMKNYKYFPQDLEDIYLEEVDLSEDEKFWLITLGYNIIYKNPMNFMEKALYSDTDGKRYKREYKVFQVDTENGNIKNMKIRKV